MPGLKSRLTQLRGKEDNDSPMNEDEKIKNLGLNRILEGLPTTGWDEWMSTYTCGCVPGYTMDPGGFSN